MPNNAPVPTIDTTSPPPISKDQECKELIAAYNAELGRYKAQGEDDDSWGKIASTAGHQRHHVFQNAAVVLANGARIISKGMGLCINLFGGSALEGSEHDVVNKSQVSRNSPSVKNPNPEGASREMQGRNVPPEAGCPHGSYFPLTNLYVWAAHRATKREPVKANCFFILPPLFS